MYLGVIAIVVVGLTGTIVLSAIGADSTGFITLFSTTLPIAITAGVTFSGLDKLKSQQNLIANNVNGNTTKLIEYARSNPNVDAFELSQIIEANNNLAKHAK